MENAKVCVGAVLYAEDKEVLCKFIITMMNDTDKRLINILRASLSILN